MKKYIIRTNEPPISKQRIEQHKDFNRLLTDSLFNESQNQSRKIRRIATGAVVTLLLFLAGLGYYYIQTPAFPSGEEKQLYPLTSMADSLVLKKEDPILPLMEKEVIANKEEKKTELDQLKEESTSVKESEKNIQVHRSKKESQEKEEPVSNKVAGQEISFHKAVPKGGMEKLLVFLTEELVYPEEELINRTEGTVILAMTIDEKGTAREIQIVQGVSEAIDAEAVRLIKNMPPWEPALLNGKAVSSRANLPIIFKITESNE